MYLWLVEPYPLKSGDEKGTHTLSLSGIAHMTVVLDYTSQDWDPKTCAHSKKAWHSTVANAQAEQRPKLTTCGGY